MGHMHDLAIITVSTNEERWLRPCLTTVFDHMGDISADVVVVDNESTDGTAALVRDEYPGARVVPSLNHGFSHANNRALMTVDARYVLLLNPDTEIVDGTFADLVRAMDERPGVGLVGCRQINGQGGLDTTIRYFPNALRALGDALSAERIPNRPGWLGERVLDPAVYDREVSCDWTSGSFMLARREAIESAGLLDERYFMYSDETDLCRRIKTQGWDVRHLPLMTIIHHEGKAGIKPHIEALNAYTRVMYARKFFSPVHRAAYTGAVMLRHVVRSVYGGSGERGALRKAASRRTVAVMLGRAPVPFAALTSAHAVLATGRPPEDARPAAAPAPAVRHDAVA
jgi:N-acetylglucosaminyl-diphospho-decaprenol L-rhamnosyltransferase